MSVAPFSIAHTPPVAKPVDPPPDPPLDPDSGIQHRGDDAVLKDANRFVNGFLGRLKEAGVNVPESIKIEVDVDSWTFARFDPSDNTIKINPSLVPEDVPEGQPQLDLLFSTLIALPGNHFSLLNSEDPETSEFIQELFDIEFFNRAEKLPTLNVHDLIDIKLTHYVFEKFGSNFHSKHLTEFDRGVFSKLKKMGVTDQQLTSILFDGDIDALKDVVDVAKRIAELPEYNVETAKKTQGHWLNTLAELGHVKSDYLDSALEIIARDFPDRDVANNEVLAALENRLSPSVLEEPLAEANQREIKEEARLLWRKERLKAEQMPRPEVKHGPYPLYHRINAEEFEASDREGLFQELLTNTRLQMKEVFGVDPNFDVDVSVVENPEEAGVSREFTRGALAFVHPSQPDKIYVVPQHDQNVGYPNLEVVETVGHEFAHVASIDFIKWADGDDPLAVRIRNIVFRHGGHGRPLASLYSVLVEGGANLIASHLLKLSTGQEPIEQSYRNEGKVMDLLLENGFTIHDIADVIFHGNREKLVEIVEVAERLSGELVFSDGELVPFVPTKITTLAQFQALDRDAAEVVARKLIVDLLQGEQGELLGLLEERVGKDILEKMYDASGSVVINEDQRANGLLALEALLQMWEEGQKRSGLSALEISAISPQT